MVILGLGTNVGDRLDNLRRALQFIQNIANFSVQQVSPIYISDALLPNNAPTGWDRSYLNLALRCQTELTPYDLLDKIKKIERLMESPHQKTWAPRIIDIDILAWDDLIQYDDKLHIPHENLHERPFALWPLADVAPRWIYPLPGSLQGKTATTLTEQWGSRFSGNAPLHTKQIQQRIDTPQLVGILNITPDSFSDGGQFFKPQAAYEHLNYLIESGADVIDIGAESTGPHAIPLTAAEEWQRLEPILQLILPTLIQRPLKPKISIDTRHAAVAKKALALGVDWINDVSALTDPAMQEVIADSDCDIVIMHHLGIPTNKNSILPINKNPVLAVKKWAEDQLNLLENSRIALSRVIFDIGIGYGKTAEQSLELIQHIDVFRTLKTRLLVGHSRKSFLQQLTQVAADQRDIETLVISLSLANQKVDYLRIHHVEMHSRAFKARAASATV